MNNDYLAHYGILGMKWGIRRYQNKDGSLTDKGKKRYLDPVKGKKRLAADAAYIERRIASNISWPIRTKKIEEKLKDMRFYRWQLVKDLDQKTIDRGRRWCWG